MKKLKLSIIIPAYNVENYLKDCIESIIIQDLKNIEVLLVDDGSTDQSGKICDEYAQKIPYIKVIHQINKGLSGARNTGIRNTTGEYIMFLDSDDYIYPKTNLSKIITNLTDDIIQYKFVYYYDQNKRYIMLNDFNISDSDNDNISFLLYNKLINGSFSAAATDKFFKRELIENNNVYFKEGIVSEDMEWMLRLFPKVKSYTTINENIYVYRQQRMGSITNKVKSKNVDCLFDIIKYWINYSYSNELMKKTYFGFLAYHYIILLSQLNRLNCTSEKKEEIYKYKEIINYDYNKKVKQCNKLIKFLGLKVSLKIFKLYINLKNKGLIKL